MKLENIKFKAKIKEKNKLFKVTEIATNHIIIDNKGLIVPLLMDEIEELLKFTGFKDIYEEELFEKDLVIYQRYVGAEEIKCIVDKGEYCIFLRELEGDRSFVLNSKERVIEKIGNIYTNPELLEGIEIIEEELR